MSPGSLIEEPPRVLTNPKWIFWGVYCCMLWGLCEMGPRTAPVTITFGSAFQRLSGPFHNPGSAGPLGEEACCDSQRDRGRARRGPSPCPVRTPVEAQLVEATRAHLTSKQASAHVMGETLALRAQMGTGRRGG